MNTPTNTSKRSTVRTGLAGVAVTTAALVGGLTVLPTLVGAQETEPDTPETPDSTQPEAPLHRHPRGLLKHNTEVVSELLDLTPEEMREAFLEGTTLAELSQAQGVPVSDLISALATEAETRVAERLEAGDITQEQADRFLDGLEDRITERVNADRPVREERGHRGHHGEGAEIVSELLNMTPEEIREGFQSGSTLAELAEDRGVATEDLVDALVADARARVDAKLESGAITEEQADSILENMKERIEDRVNADRPLERPGRNGRLGHRGSSAAEMLDA
jgi:lambda repressor-like predicted transcriptional regulator